MDYLRGREKEVLSIMLELFDKEEAYRRSVLARENRAEDFPEVLRAGGYLQGRV